MIVWCRKSVQKRCWCSKIGTVNVITDHTSTRRVLICQFLKILYLILHGHNENFVLNFKMFQFFYQSFLSSGGYVCGLLDHSFGAIRLMQRSCWFRWVRRLDNKYMRSAFGRSSRCESARCFACSGTLVTSFCHHLVFSVKKNSALRGGLQLKRR